MDGLQQWRQQWRQYSPLSVILFRVHTVYGHWDEVLLEIRWSNFIGVWYIDDVIDILQNSIWMKRDLILGCNFIIDLDQSSTVKNSLAWAEDFASRISWRRNGGTQEMVFTLYFASVQDPPQ